MRVGVGWVGSQKGNRLPTGQHLFLGESVGLLKTAYTQLPSARPHSSSIDPQGLDLSTMQICGGGRGGGEGEGGQGAR